MTIVGTDAVRDRNRYAGTIPGQEVTEVYHLFVVFTMLLLH